MRRSDDRPNHDDAALAQLGIRRYAAKRLVLYTDIDSKNAVGLPELADVLFEAHSKYFGELRENKEGTPFQVTGYIMQSRDKFEKAGLLPEKLPRFDHGLHQGYRFWMNEQANDYYRRHLVLHEFTHCFMTCETGRRNVPPVWFMEGMAELFGTHFVDESDSSGRRVQFAVFPHNKQDFAGLGRINLLQQLVRSEELISVDRLLRLLPGEFLDPQHYAQAWALCVFLNQHPRWGPIFHDLAKQKTFEPFQQAFHEKLQPHWRDVRTEFTLFLESICEGFDVRSAAIEFAAGVPLTGPQTVTISANRGWQSSRLRLDGQAIEISATGRFEVAQQPKPWISEPQGITIRYDNGFPRGRLLGRVRKDDGSMSPIFDIGRAKKFSATGNETLPAGTLYLRLNDAWDALQNNRGMAEVTISPVSE